MERKRVGSGRVKASCGKVVEHEIDGVGEAATLAAAKSNTEMPTVNSINGGTGVPNLPKSSSTQTGLTSATSGSAPGPVPTPAAGSLGGTAGGGGGRRKRKGSDGELAVRHELEELREWRRRVEEKERQLTALFSACSNCIVCLDMRPDLVSYGACGHMVCCSCAIDHVTRTLMVMRRHRSQNTGCSARLSHFALNPEETEFSCPMCRKGQLDLMGTGLSLLPDFAYYQLAAYCASKSHQVNTPTPTPILATQPPTKTPQSDALPAGLSAERRAMVLAEMERNRAAAIRALQQSCSRPTPQQHQKTSSPAVSASSASGVYGLRCPFCGLVAAQPGERGPDKLLPSELLRHVWRCRKRSFICGFSDCQRPFTWESVYTANAPPTVGSAGDIKTEIKWLRLVNAAFSEHMRTDCIHKTECCIGWCDYYRGPARIQMCKFAEHETRHKLIHTRFQTIGKITDTALRVERTLAAVLRSEFNAEPSLPAPAPTASVLATNQPSRPTQPNTTAPTTAVAAAAVGARHSAGPRGDVMSFAGPIAREIHNSLDALDDLLRSYVRNENGESSGTGNSVELAELVRCPLHDDSSSAAMSATAAAAAAARARRPRTRSQQQINHLFADGDDDDDDDDDDEEEGAITTDDEHVILEDYHENDPQNEADDEDYVPPPETAPSNTIHDHHHDHDADDTTDSDE